MLTILNSIATKEEYNKLKAAWLIKAEGTSNAVYVDSLGVPTIGIGWALHDQKELNQFLRSDDGLGITHDDTLAGNGVPQVMTDAKSQEMSNKIFELTKKTSYGNGGRIDDPTDAEKKLNNDINDILKIYFPATENSPQKKFEFASEQKQIDFLNNVGSDTYETKLINQLRANGVIGANEDVPYSYERLALWDLTFNLGSLSSSLIESLKSNKRFDVWFEIRYATNANLLAGLAKRRYATAAMIGLYGSGSVESQADALISKLFSPLTFKVNETIKATAKDNPNVIDFMIAYEKYNSFWKYANYNNTSGENYSTDAKNDYRKVIGSFSNQLAFQDIFKPIAGQLINKFIEGESVGINGVDFAKNDYFSGAVNVGFDFEGVIQSQYIDNSHRGVDKSDLLIAIDDSKANTLKGGKKDDFLIGAKLGDTLDGGDDNDILVGKDGDDLLKGSKGYDELYGGKDKDTLYGGSDADHLYGGSEDDTLNGGDEVAPVVGNDGNDILEGGAGNDKYIFTGAFGRDIIKDSDGNGSVVISGNTVSQFLQSSKDSNLYYNNLTNPTLQAVVMDEGNTKSLVISTVSKSGENILRTGNGVTVKNWNGTSLGLSLSPFTTPAAPTNTLNATGTTGDNYLTTYALSPSGSYVASTIKSLANFNLNASGGAGRDFLQGLFNGSDTLLGGDGDDIINGGANVMGTGQDINPYNTFFSAATALRRAPIISMVVPVKTTSLSRGKTPWPTAVLMTILFARIKRCWGYSPVTNPHHP